MLIKSISELLSKLLFKELLIKLLVKELLNSISLFSKIVLLLLLLKLFSNITISLVYITFLFIISHTLYIFSLNPNKNALFALGSNFLFILLFLTL
jgi:hypothetical protein